MRFSRSIIGLTSRIVFSAQVANVNGYTTQLPAGANLVLMVQEVGALAPVTDYHSQQITLPASTQEMITAPAALIQPSSDFRLTTTLEVKGSVENGVLKGDLVARFDADPTLKRQDIRNMVATLEKSGVNQTDGNVLIDTSIFASHDKAPSWPWNDMTQCFSTPPAAAIVDRNCFFVLLYSTPKPGDMAFICVASYYPVTAFNQVRILLRDSAETQYYELDMVPGGLNRFTLAGCLPQRSEPLPLAFTVQDGTSCAGAILKDELRQTDITWNETSLRQIQINEPGTIAASKQSALLHDLLKIILKKSDSVIVDAVFRIIDHTRFNVPGTWRARSDTVRWILHQQIGIGTRNTIIADGSGLSRHNLTVPATMTQVLRYITQHDNELNFISMLPLAGYDSSLQYHAGLHQAGVGGKVSAKTGSLQGVYNLAGFITIASGQRMAFVQHPSGYIVGPADQHNRRIPLVRSESRLYRDIYRNN